jgi:thiamine-phosphate pyrophosphorylase
LPLFGVGGVTPQNARRLVEIGASGVAVVSYVTQSDAPDERVKALLEAISPGA